MFFDWFQENNLKVEDCIGIDEVGRGPLAGPVVSAAVWISKDAADELDKISQEMPVRDSKKLSHAQRQKVLQWIEEKSKDLSALYGIGQASVEEIDTLNIRNAAFLSMKRAYEDLYRKLKMSKEKSLKTVLVDGNAVPNLFDPETQITHKHKPDVRAVVKGDAKVLSISMASIVAKEFRDDIMQNLAADYPQYAWQTNVGYGTKEHLEAIKQTGITKYHRKSFAPIKGSTNSM